VDRSSWLSGFAFRSSSLHLFERTVAEEEPHDAMQLGAECLADLAFIRAQPVEQWDDILDRVAELHVQYPFRKALRNQDAMIGHLALSEQEYPLQGRQSFVGL